MVVWTKAHEKESVERTMAAPSLSIVFVVSVNIYAQDCVCISGVCSVHGANQMGVEPGFLWELQRRVQSGRTCMNANPTTASAKHDYRLESQMRSPSAQYAQMGTLACFAAHASQGIQCSLALASAVKHMKLQRMARNLKQTPQLRWVCVRRTCFPLGAPACAAVPLA
jgi:hypothetical protein